MKANKKNESFHDDIIPLQGDLYFPKTVQTGQGFLDSTFTQGREMHFVIHSVSIAEDDT